MALFLVLAEDSSASCLSARGFSTWLKMVVGMADVHPQALPSLDPLSHLPRIYSRTHEQLVLTPSCSQLKDGSQDSLADCVSPHSAGGIDNKLLLEELDTALHPGKGVHPGGRPLGSGYRGLEVQNTSLLGTS